MEKEESILKCILGNQLILSRAPEGLKDLLTHPRHIGVPGRDMSNGDRLPAP